MRNQSGSALVVAILVLLTVLGIGIGGYYVWSQQQTDDEEGSLEPIGNNEEGALDDELDASAPEGFVVYQNSELGFSFVHPVEWGSVDISRYDRDHQGDQYRIGFSGSSVVGAIATADYEYTGPAMGGSTTEIAALSMETNRQSYSGKDIIATGDKYFIGASSSCEYSGEILLRLYMSDVNDYALLQFTWPYQVDEDFDCQQEIHDGMSLLQFFSESAFATFETMATGSR